MTAMIVMVTGAVDTQEVMTTAPEVQIKTSLATLGPLMNEVFLVVEKVLKNSMQNMSENAKEIEDLRREEILSDTVSVRLIRIKCTKRTYIHLQSRRVRTEVAAREAGLRGALQNESAGAHSNLSVLETPTTLKILKT